MSIHFHSIECCHLLCANWDFYLRIISDCKSLFSCPSCTVNFVYINWGCWIWPFGIWRCWILWKRTIESNHLCWYHSVTINYTHFLTLLRQEISFHTKIYFRTLMSCHILISVDSKVWFPILKFIRLISCPTSLIYHMPICSSSILHYQFLCKNCPNISCIQCYRMPNQSNCSSYLFIVIVVKEKNLRVGN